MECTSVAVTGGFGKTMLRLRLFALAVTVSSFICLHYVLLDASYSLLFTADEDYEDALPGKRKKDVVYLIAAVVAAPIFAFICQKFCRKTCVYMACAIYIVATMFVLIANSFSLVMVVVVFTAVGDTWSEMISTIYLSEIAPDEIRGALLGICTLWHGLTQFILHINYVFYPIEKNRRFLFHLWTCFPFLIFIAGIMHFLLPESPIYFLRKQDRQGAERSLQWLYGSEANITEEIQKRKLILQATRSDSETSKASVLQQYFDRRAVFYSGLFIVLVVIRSFVGYANAHLELKMIFWELESRRDMQFFSISDIIFTVVANIITISTCDRVGRKLLLLVSAFGSSATLIGSGIGHIILESKVNKNFLLDDEDTPETPQIVIIVLSLMFTFFYHLGFSILYNVILVDIFPPNILNIQIAITRILAEILHFVLVNILYDIIKTAINVSGVFWVFGTVSAIGALIIFMFLPETKGNPPGYPLRVKDQAILLSNLEEDEEEQYILEESRRG